LERATGIEPVLPTWEGKYSTLYFQHLQKRPRKICVHALHTVHALPDMRIAGGRFGGRFLAQILLPWHPLCQITQSKFLMGCQHWRATAKSRKLKAVSQVIARTS
jgi:hypothetical protein